MATYEMRLAPDPSSPTGFSLQYVYVPSTPVERAQAQIGEIARGLGRQLGLTGRYIAEGTAGTVGIVTNPLAAMGAAATGDMRNFVPLQEQVSRGLTALGVPEPRGAVEESVAGLSRAVAGAGGVAGAARAAIPVATGAVSRGTITELAAMPGRQLAAGATGEGARQLAEAGGAGPIGQTLAAVGGGAIPFAGAPTTTASLVDDLSAAYRPGSVVRSGAGPVPPPPPRRPSPFDYRAVEEANPQPRPFEIAEPLPAPATYDEAIQQVADLRAQLADADRNVRLSTSIQNPARAGLRSLDQRAVLERQLAAAEGHLARLRPAAPERQNAPGTSEAARAYLERLGMGRVADLGSTRAAAPEPLGPVRPGPTSVSAMGATPGVRTADLDPLGFSSTALEAAKALPDRPLPVAEAMSLIQQGRGVQGMTARTKAEMDFLGLREAFAGRGKVTKQELVDYIEANRLVLGEVTNTRETGTLRVGNRYDLDTDPNVLRGETVITLPPNVPGGDVPGAHTGVTGDLLNILWSARTDDKGGRTLFVRQLQSDLAQRGRKVKGEQPANDPPLTKQTSLWTGAGVRAMVIKAARDGYDSISFPTSKTSTLIQGNDQAAGHYEENVLPELQKIAKALGGRVRRGEVEHSYDARTMAEAAAEGDVEDLIEPERFNGVRGYRATAMDGRDLGWFEDLQDAFDAVSSSGPGETVGAQTATVYILDIPKDARTRIQDFGLPLFGVGAAGAMAAGAMQEPERQID